MSEPIEDPPAEDVPDELVEVAAPRGFATLGEVLEAHHRRFVERLRRRREEQEES